MISVSVRRGDAPSNSSATALLLAASDQSALTDVGARWGLDLAAMVTAMSVRTNQGDVTSFAVPTAQFGVQRLIIVATTLSANGPSADNTRALRDAAMYAVQHCAGASSMDLVIPDTLHTAANLRVLAEGVVLGSYRCPTESQRADDVPAYPVECALVTSSSPSPEAVEAVRRGGVVAQRTNWVRDLVAMPPDRLSPSALAEIIEMEAATLGVQCSVWSGDDLVRQNFGAVRGVGQGSTRPPCVVELRWGEGAPLAMTGKGITFDAGGINLKTTHEVSYMKSDMASAAAVAGALFATVELGLSTPLHALLPLAENMPSGNAIRPGDVLHHPGGLTTEVTNTDAEGRLVLADCIAHLAPMNPRAIIDIGTLTDAAGYGTSLVAAMSNSPALLESFVASAATSGDRAWPMPYLKEYEALLRSSVADVVNSSLKVPDTSVLTGTYLGMFAGETPWLHLDTGSTAWLEDAVGPWPAGATGSPTRSLFAYIETLAR